MVFVFLDHEEITKDKKLHMKNYKHSERKGFALEEYVAGVFSEIFQNKAIRPTKNSGASGEIGDISNPYFAVECKDRSTKNITIKKDTWDKLCSEIPLSSKKLPLYILQNKTKDIYAVLNFTDFCRIMRRLYSEGLL